MTISLRKKLLFFLSPDIAYKLKVKFLLMRLKGLHFCSKFISDFTNQIFLSEDRKNLKIGSSKLRYTPVNELFRNVQIRHLYLLL